MLLERAAVYSLAVVSLAGAYAGVICFIVVGHTNVTFSCMSKNKAKQNNNLCLCE